MPEAVFGRILSESLSVDAIVIGGVGEPTVHPQFNRFSRLLSHGNMELTSNACAWDEETLQTIASCYKKVIVSVDGLPESFSAARGFAFEVMAENVRRLAAARRTLKTLIAPNTPKKPDSPDSPTTPSAPNAFNSQGAYLFHSTHVSPAQSVKFPLIHAQLTLTKDNLHDIRELIPLLKGIGFNHLIISNLLPQTDEDKDRIVYTPWLQREMKDFVSAWYPVSSAHQLPLKIPQTKFNAEHRCAFVENGALFITAGGDVAPCYRFAHDGCEYVFGRKKEIKSVSFGNILDNKLLDIWQRKDYLTFRFQNYASRYPSCIDCDLVDFCDYVSSSEADCRANEPSCADCLWCRGLIECP